MSKVKKYVIGERNFEQRRLVFGQTLQIKAVFAELFEEIRTAGTPGNLTSVLGDQVPRFAAIVLREKGQRLKEKDLETLEDYLAENIDAPTAAAVVSDFLALTPIASDLTALGTLATAIGETVVTALKSLSATLPEETSPEETRSSGTTDTKTAESG
ncbi:MAG: hypothetical protein L3J57_01645 [Desulfuromusa sp.]|nr:hypothetical protein [Desulfuromusa sp.]